MSASKGTRLNGRYRGQKKRRLHEGGVGPTMLSSAGFTWRNSGREVGGCQALLDGTGQRVIAYIDGRNLHFGFVQRVRACFPGKRVIIALPPERRSYQPTQAANGSLVIGADKIRKNKLPEQITKADGFVLQRPAYWT